MANPLLNLTMISSANGFTFLVSIYAKYINLTLPSTQISSQGPTKLRIHNPPRCTSNTYLTLAFFYIFTVITKQSMYFCKETYVANVTNQIVYTESIVLSKSLVLTRALSTSDVPLPEKPIAKGVLPSPLSHNLSSMLDRSASSGDLKQTQDWVLLISNKTVPTTKYNPPIISILILSSSQYMHFKLTT